MYSITLESHSREEMIPVGSLIQKEVRERGWGSGLLFLHCPHTTAGITINESADPDVRKDMCGHLKLMVPQDSAFRHYEGNSDAHIKSSLMGPQLFLIIEEGRLALGQWQEIYFCEWDGPRTRQLWFYYLNNEQKA